MSGDITKMKVDNVWRYIKDTIARNDAATAQSTADSKVSKSGDTMTGMLTIENNANNAFEKVTTIDNRIDITNTPSTSLFNTMIQARDINRAEMAHVEAAKLNDGYSQLGMTSYNSSHDVNGLFLGINEDGTSKVSVTSPDEWRKAIWDNIYIINELPSAVSVANKKGTTIASHSFSVGLYIIIYCARFASNNSGYRQVWLSESSSGDTDVGMISKVSCAPANGDETIITNMITRKVTTDNTALYVVAQQSSGGALSVTGRMMIFKLI